MMLSELRVPKQYYTESNMTKPPSYVTFTRARDTIPIRHELSLYRKLLRLNGILLHQTMRYLYADRTASYLTNMDIGQYTYKTELYVITPTPQLTARQSHLSILFLYFTIRAELFITP